MLRLSPNHGTQRVPNDDDDDELVIHWLDWYVSLQVSLPSKEAYVTW